MKRLIIFVGAILALMCISYAGFARADSTVQIVVTVAPQDFPVGTTDGGIKIEIWNSDQTSRIVPTSGVTMSAGTGQPTGTVTLAPGDYSAKICAVDSTGAPLACIFSDVFSVATSSTVTINVPTAATVTVQ